MKRKTSLSRILQLVTTKPPDFTGLPRQSEAKAGRPPHLTQLTHLTYLTLLAVFLATAALAQTAVPPDPSSIIQNPSSLPVDPGVLQPFLDGLVGKYGWLTTVLLAMGSLRILFKPIMLVIENALKNDPAKYAAVQKFEAS